MVFPFIFPVDGRVTLPFVGSFDTENVVEVFRGAGDVLKEFGGACASEAMGGVRSLGRSATSGLLAWKDFFAQRVLSRLHMAAAPLDGVASTTRGVTVAVELDAIETGRANAAVPSPSEEPAPAEEEEDKDETEDK